MLGVFLTIALTNTKELRVEEILSIKPDKTLNSNKPPILPCIGIKI